MTPGQFLLRFYHTPMNRLKDSLRNGGPLTERETERQRQLMIEAARHLPELPQPANAPRVALHLLTGKRFLYQAAFCLHSFARHSGAAIEAHVYDDGSFDEDLLSELARLGPGVVFHPMAETSAKLDALLPESRFPVLRERWRNYPNIRKLTDPHLGSTGWKLVIDSDLLFFRRPDFLLAWCAAPDRPLHAVDCAESYGYSRSLLEKLAGAPIPPLVNVGLCGLRSELLDWNELEAWCAELIAREKTSYYLEQALVAMLVARTQPCAIAPAGDYLTKPDRAEGMQPRAVMHHYVAESKRWYYRHGWREAQRALKP
ncbi:glycosyl transferase [Oleiharenicola lentus]|uniref:Glycosyl transferase n=1 Tax=Oleiharenicola lentus TaxID=2508720 RepID=A0A4Q1CC51_9BACT|nr:glycosyl transferase [Oleiharenicola lentus]RXK56521.1 glycosyl transferase [Oleiharenicola lentus]